MPDQCFTVTDQETGQEFHVKTEHGNNCTKAVCASLKTIGRAAGTLRMDKTLNEKSTEKYVFGKMDDPYNAYDNKYLESSRKNVDVLKTVVVSVSQIAPHVMAEESSILRLVRRYKIRELGKVFGVVLEVTSITIIAIEEGGFGRRTEVATGKAIGDALGAEAALAIGAQIGAALGTVIPGLGNVALAFIGAFIGGLVGGGITAFIFHVESVAPGLGPPFLDTDPRDTARGVPDDGLNTGTHGVPSLGICTGANGVPSLGLDTGAFGTPKADYKTEEW